MLKKLYFLLAGLLFPVIAFAQAPIVSCSGLSCGITDLIAIPVRIFNFLLGLSGFVLLAVIIFAGVRIILFSFSESPESELANAKNTLRQGITGFIIIGLSWVIVNTFLGLFSIGTGTGLGAAIFRYLGF